MSKKSSETAFRILIIIILIILLPILISVLTSSNNRLLLLCIFGIPFLLLMLVLVRSFLRTRPDKKVKQPLPARVPEMPFAQKEYAEEQMQTRFDVPPSAPVNTSAPAAGRNEHSDPELDLWLNSLKVIVETRIASTAFLQRKMKLGFPHAAKIMDDFEKMGYIGPQNGSGARSVNISAEDFAHISEQYRNSALMPPETPEEQVQPEQGVREYSVEHWLAFADSLSSNGQMFESFTMKLLLDNGFDDAEVTRGSGDYGVDVIAHKDGVSYAIQCKCYSGSVGNKAVQEAFSGKDFYKCMVAVVFTNSYFTEAAKETAKRNNVLLWDRKKLIELVRNAKPF